MSNVATTPIVESVHIAGDRGTGHGHAIDYDMTSGAHAKVRLTYTGRYAHPFAELVIVCEIYKAPDGMLSVHSICPKCHKGVMVKGDQKRIDYDPDRGLFVEPFGCTWELEGDRAMQFGLGLCKFRCAYDGRVVKEA
jgi:hypothetical protein